MNSPVRGDRELLGCVLLARQVQSGELTWQAGCGEIARRVIDGRVNPNDGCALLAEISASTGCPALSEFEHLAHLQAGHEDIGVTAASCVSEILQECHRLVLSGLTATVNTTSQRTDETIAGRANRMLEPLIDSWCDRREIFPLRLLLPHFPVPERALTDTWGDLLTAIRSIRARHGCELPPQELDDLVSLQHFVDSMVHRKHVL
jgi:hypothetical protein